jgi:hypothetical protein
MSNPPFSNSSELSNPAAANHALCTDLSLLFTLQIAALVGAISRIAGKPLADQFEQEINRYAGQHGWSALTGLTNLTELKQRVPDVDARMLLTVYLSYIRQARALAGKVVGDQVLRSTLSALLDSLPSPLAEVNRLYGVIRL